MFTPLQFVMAYTCWHPQPKPARSGITSGTVHQAYSVEKQEGEQKEENKNQGGKTGNKERKQTPFGRTSRNQAQCCVAETKNVVSSCPDRKNGSVIKPRPKQRPKNVRRLPRKTAALDAIKRRPHIKRHPNMAFHYTVHRGWVGCWGREKLGGNCKIVTGFGYFFLYVLGKLRK